ncbi:MAG: RsmD family RNA methyltransferase [Chitinophagaceae bacterium]|jgi:16S rRNA (guanine(966)-N(2))-methyltransferase RsmD|nr:RsmD family RNA methyltransferase [Chitinophagaceae bacterium]MBK7679667.1 RsmD family RNA methyltransferase [Chitinophagaceae bacterium]MBK8298980.1 RsmD family RNA methyltransferase [Chitinophagaceae bacterium]MBK9464802.1 RsmD family RNA methyltransferase [Chitinophagaceae bacterium]MBK9659838.1 RsmD family RNA methyltransferase [Chitinophagaceae bacterium]
MRIIGGEHGGRKFNPPNNMPYTRPTTDIAKEGLFNVLQHNLDFDEIKSLDLFGGTGSISYELASRGVTDLTIVEKDVAMYEFIKKTSATLRIENLHVIKMDVFKFINQCTDKFDFIFAGPPYALTAIDDLPKLIFERHLLKKNGWFVLEHTPRNDYKSFPFYKTERNYGTTVFSTFAENREL